LFVAGDQHAVAGHHQVGLDEVGAERDRLGTAGLVGAG
jgi:hypothetical protein